MANIKMAVKPEVAAPEQKDLSRQYADLVKRGIIQSVQNLTVDIKNTSISRNGAVSKLKDEKGSLPKEFNRFKV